MRERLAASIKDAMLARDTLRLATLRLMSAALKDQEIARRTRGEAGDMPEVEIHTLFAKMVRQREESARIYEEAGRMDMAEAERAEQEFIREFLPKPMTGAEIDAAVAQAIGQTGAKSIRDMGRVMGALKKACAGRMDFGEAGARVKAALR